MIRIIFLIIIFITVSVPAFAGFEWTPPAKVQAQERRAGGEMPAPSPAPLTPVDQAPVEKMNVNHNPAPPPPPVAGMKSLTISEEEPEGIVIRRNKPNMSGNAGMGNAQAIAKAQPQDISEPTPLPPSAPPPEQDLSVMPEPIVPPADAMPAAPLPEPPPAEMANVAGDVLIEPPPVSDSVELQAIRPIVPVADASILEGFGRDVPLALALQQIVPQGYAYAIAPNVNGGVSLTWTGGKSWIEELNQALAVHGYAATVRGRTLLINAPESIAAFPASPMMDEVFNKTKPVDIIKADIQETRIWQAQPGDSLRRILSDWSKSTGVTLYWPDESDYVLTKSIRVNGTYAEAIDAVLTSLSALEPRPTAKLHVKNGSSGPVLAIQES